MANQSRRGWQRIVSACANSWQGLRACWQFEEAFRQETITFVIAIPLAFWLGDTGTERALLMLSLFILLITELLNSAIETTVDRVGLEHNKLSGRAKDIASAAVLLALLQVAVIWAIILLT